MLNVLTQAQLVLLECTFCVFLKSILTAIEHNLSGPSYCIIPSLHGRLPAGVIALRSRWLFILFACRVLNRCRASLECNFISRAGRRQVFTCGLAWDGMDHGWFSLALKVFCWRYPASFLIFLSVIFISDKLLLTLILTRTQLDVLFELSHKLSGHLNLLFFGCLSHARKWLEYFPLGAVWSNRSQLLLARFHQVQFFGCNLPAL